MTDKEIYQIWAPYGKKWTDWVRPVPFVGIREHSGKYHFSNLTVPVPALEERETEGTAVIVDLPGVESVLEGIALARIGFRPVPVFNGTMEQPGARATVDNQAVGVGLVWGATLLSDMEIEEEAPPAFLMDCNRLNRFKMEDSLFDNSWDIYPQDIPSAEYLIKNGIDRIVIIANRLSKDLAKILYGFQKKGIRICITEGYEKPRIIKIRTPIKKD
nr:hypothetical protein [Lachnospiraceae bacterium]